MKVRLELSYQPIDVSNAFPENVAVAVDDIESLDPRVAALSAIQKRKQSVDFMTLRFPGANRQDGLQTLHDLQRVGTYAETHSIRDVCLSSRPPETVHLPGSGRSLAQLRKIRVDTVSGQRSSLIGSVY